MAQIDIDERFKAVDDLIKRMNQFAPPENLSATEFRADLARLLVIAIVSAYEASVRATLIEYAKRHHDVFGCYIEANYEKLNAQIKVKQLKGLAKKFAPKLEEDFINELTRTHHRFATGAHLDFCHAYCELVKLRHRFAHATTAVTTIEEAERRHRVAKHVIYAFDRVFSE